MRNWKSRYEKCGKIFTVPSLFVRIIVTVLLFSPQTIKALTWSNRNYSFRSHWQHKTKRSHEKLCFNVKMKETRERFSELHHYSTLTRIPSSLRSKGGDGEENTEDHFITDAFKSSDLLEIRLDATLASCYGLSRFFIYDITTGAKDMPGWQLSDFIMLGGAFSSCIVLSILWTFVGIFTGIFESTSTSDDENSFLQIVLTALIVGPFWLLVEICLGWPPSGVLIMDNLITGNIIDMIVGTVATGTIGLASVMAIGRSIPPELR